MLPNPGEANAPLPRFNPPPFLLEALMAPPPPPPPRAQRQRTASNSSVSSATRVSVDARPQDADVSSAAPRR